MKHQIDSIINEYFSCYQILFATYASYKKRDYEMIFAESWDFEYENNDCPFGVSLSSGSQSRSELILDKFHGIKIKKVQYTSKENLLDLIHEILPDSPIMLYYDVFDCPWNIAYRRNHIKHSILLIGIDEKKDLYVLDPYSTKDEIIININDFARNHGRLHSFMLMPLEDLQPDDYRSEICTHLNYMKNDGFFKKLECFKNSIQTRFEEAINSEYTDIYAIPLIINLRHIANQRYCYCIFLEKMIDKKIIDISMLNLMKNIAWRYSSLRMSLMKQIMKKKSNNENGSIINEIMNEEYEAYKKMKSFI